MALLELPAATPRPRVAPPPVPLSAMVCGLSEALSIICRVPVASFSEVGEKVMLTVQLLPLAIEGPQLFVFANGPLVWIREISNAITPVLVIVTVCGA